ncbi:class I SAM-dependent methyltransferase [Enterococcus casseliflavus]|nr:class I SAM-dependent methyltransferase [Enterococcus casseliflavus]MBE9899626.1 class I SAM-dependent methyltransferase [Enterococcus casseliflavus]MBE9902912.1 class I SAM-dependent methyltransferase [Enterococcus casseliflavus]MBE9923039.1 class I SAM-dependent methyltransferase [Enterococcus casseliflavus]
MNLKILDACCGSRMFWFDKQNPNVTFMDIRRHYEELETGHVIDVDPDIVGDFRDMPFEDDAFDMVVFDPPHLIHAGENSWLAKKYGKLDGLWPEDIRQGFAECMRVLKPNGSLIFKWNEDQISLQEVLAAIGEKPLFGNKRSKTHWLVFMK